MGRFSYSIVHEKKRVSIISASDEWVCVITEEILVADIFLLDRCSQIRHLSFSHAIPSLFQIRSLGSIKGGQEFH